MQHKNVSALNAMIDIFFWVQDIFSLEMSLHYIFFWNHPYLPLKLNGRPLRARPAWMKIKTAGDLIPLSAKPQGDGDTRQIVFGYLNMYFTIFFIVILSDLSKLSLSFKTKT